MKRRRILVVEDDPMLALSLEQIILDAGPAEVIAIRTIADAERELTRCSFGFALLDVHLADGKSYKIADILEDHGVPFAFVSGATRDPDVPAHLRHIPLLPKPYRPGLICALLRKL